MRPPEAGIGGLRMGSVLMLTLWLFDASIINILREGNPDVFHAIWFLLTVQRLPDLFEDTVPRQFVFVARVVDVCLEIYHNNFGRRKSLPAME